VGLCAARLAATPLAILNDHHSAEVVLRGKPLPMWADRILTRWLPHFVVAPSSYMRRILIDEQGVPAEKIEVIPYGLDLTRWRASEGSRERIRAELGVDDRIVLGAVGRLQWVKNYPALLSAFAAVARDHDDTCLVIAGEGPDRARLEELVAHLSLEDRVIFAGHRKDIADFLSAIDLLVHASLVECAVQVVSEAYLLGKPVVSTEVGGASELVDNGVNGYLVRPGSSDALAEALRTMLGRRENWEEMGEVGRARVRRNSAEHILPKTEAQVLHWLAERGGSGTSAA